VTAFDPDRLSTADLGYFFDDRHQKLAGQLLAASKMVEAADGHAAVARAMGSAGLYRWFVPDDGKVDVRCLCVIREMLGYISPLADAVFAVHGLGSYPIVLAGSEQQKSLLDGCRSGERIGAFALTEPEAGSDVASMKTSATADGDDFVLNGDKTLISNVGIASHYIVFAKVGPEADPQPGHRNITAFVVDSGAEGLTEVPFEVNVDHPIGALEFRNCRVSSTAVLGEVGGGFGLAMHTLDSFRISVGAAAVGMARRALDEAVAHVTSRVQFGKTLGEQQLVQAHLADSATQLDAARLLVLRAAHSKDHSSGDKSERTRLSSEAAKAKLFATEAAQTIIDRAVQLHGGRGVTSGEVVENLYRAIRPLRIYEGTSEILRLIIGRAIIGGVR